ncbi:MAG TPA: type II toxin-antitoxin system prevent-host-death family antitoxin [Terracidiphilus sp.]|jgi:antitoxin Phd|nr:type II toxin-antitoxin system prevent-host-death family antitoxin [Terracidiphilus sp.]
MVVKTSAEAQNKFGELLDLAQREPVAITRHGRTAAFIISPRDMDEIINAREGRKRAAAELKAWRMKYKNQISPEASSLTMEEINRMVHELR